MKQILWVIALAVVLVAGPTRPAVAAGGGGGFHGGGGGFHGGGFQGGHGFHGGGFHGGTRVVIGGGFGWWGWPGWWGPGWWSAPYPYSAPSPVVTQSAPMTYIQQAPAPDAYWYYCNAAGAYYPYVKDCPGGWMQVVPAPNPPGP